MSELRDRLADARLMLVFTPAVVESVGRDPLGVLEACLGEVDVVQVRAKSVGQRSGPSSAREAHTWTSSVLDLCRALGDGAPLVVVNDRVDVAAHLAARGCAGCHIGQDDLPANEARAIVGTDRILGLSTHGTRQVAEAYDVDVDYLGFGPVFPSETKGYERGLGPEAAWVASNAAAVPVFPIGGIDEARAVELATIGRAAVSAAILGADDPAAAARRLRATLAAD
jgi:thiamine-phosphate pyrophosphorylase